MLPVLKRAVGNYHRIEFEIIKRHSVDEDYRINIYQLDTDSKRTDTFHPIEDVCAVAQVFNVHIYVTTLGNVICVALF